jgi:membrane carboxypeptidase/penicillin-binding protein PbpC
MLNKKHMCFWQLETVGNCKPSNIQEFFKTCRSKRPQAAFHLLVVWLGHAELSNAEVVSLYEARADNGIIGAVAQRCIEPHFC